MPEGKVIILSDYVGGEGAGSGGAGHAALDSYRALQNAGVDVRVITGFGPVPVGERAHFTSLRGRDLRLGGSIDALRAIYNLAARRALAGELEHHDPTNTLIILHQWTRYLSPAAIGLLQRFKTMVYMHDYFWACPNGAYYDFAQERPCDRAPLGARCVSANCDRSGMVLKAGRIARQAVHRTAIRNGSGHRLLLHLSERALHTAAPLLPGERHAVLYNPIAVPAYPPPVPEPRYDFGYFGRMEPEKGVRLLIDAAERLGLKGLFVGQGALQNEVAHRPLLELRPWAPRAAMLAAMRSCRTVVLPSLWHETWGLTVPEAMAAGVKVCVSARAGAAELVTQFGGGATFDPGVPGDLDRALLSLQEPAFRAIGDWPAFRAHLSPERHASRIAMLASEQFGLDLLRPQARIPIEVASMPRSPIRDLHPLPPM